MMTKPGESPVGRQHQSHPEETEEELREHQDGGALPPGVTIKQEPPDPQELQEEVLQQQQQHRERERQAEQELLFRQVVRQKDPAVQRRPRESIRIDPTPLGTNALEVFMGKSCRGANSKKNRRRRQKDVSG